MNRRFILDLLDCVNVKKDFYYINIWCIACQPCIDEFVILDNLAKEWCAKIPFVLVSPHSETAFNSFIKRSTIQTENLFYLNERKLFIENLFNILDISLFPLHILVDKDGNIHAFSKGGFKTEEDTVKLTNFFKLKLLENSGN